LVHESGHALAAILQGIPCYGIYWKKGVGTGKFCALSPDPTEHDRKYFVFLAAGSAAELLTYGSYDEDAARSDKMPFEHSDAPRYDEAVKEARELLSRNKRTLKRLVSMLKAICLRVDLNISKMPERGMDGSVDRFNELMPETKLLPIPRKSTASHFYKYSSTANLGWLKDILHKHEIYLPNLAELNDDNDGLPHLAMQTEEEMAKFLSSKLAERNPTMSLGALEREAEVIRFNVRLHGPAALHPDMVRLLDEELRDFRIYSMTRRYDMGNLWALYANGHRGYCLEFQNVGPLFEHAKDVNYLDRKDMEISISDPELTKAYFLFCKTREWSCEEEVRLVLSRKDGRKKVAFDPAWLTRIILGKTMSEDDRNTIRLWAREREPELTLVTTYYDAAARVIKLREN
jgi:hypothetical protein